MGETDSPSSTTLDKYCYPQAAERDEFKSGEISKSTGSRRSICIYTIHILWAHYYSWFTNFP